MGDLSLLTGFQVQTEAALRAALEAEGAELSDRRLEGVRETYVQCRIGSTEVHAFIYNDEAGLYGPGVDLRFEVPDFDTPEDLSAAFVQQAVLLLGK